MFIGCVDHKSSRDIIPQSLTVFVGMARRKPIPCLVIQLSSQRGAMCRIQLSSSSTGCRSEPLLNTLPDIEIYDGCMLPLKNLSVVSDFACIDRVAEYLVKMPAPERYAALSVFRFGNPPLCTQIQFLRLLLNFAD